MAWPMEERAEPIWVLSFRQMDLFAPAAAAGRGLTVTLRTLGETAVQLFMFT